MIDQNALTRMWRHLTEGPPVQGDVLPYDDELYQFRGTAWVEVCKLKQPDLSDEDALMWEVGDTYVLADAANLIATIVDISRHDRRFSLEEMVQQVFRLMRESGWVDMRGVENGRVYVTSGETGWRARDEEYLVVNINEVMDALKSGNTVPLVGLSGNVTFLHPNKWSRVTCTMTTPDNEEPTK